MSKCGCCPKEAVAGGFYCNDCLSRWDRQRRNQSDKTKDNELQTLKDTVADLVTRIELLEKKE